MNSQDYRNLQEAYRQVYSSQRLNEFGPIDGGSLAVKRTFGGAPGTPQNTTLSGSASFGGSNISGSLEKGTFPGQEKVTQGVDNALSNYNNRNVPNSKPLDTSTSTPRTTGIRGTLNANVSGKIGSGVTPQDAARKSAMQKQTMLTPAPTTPPATKLPQEPAPKTPVAKTPVAILNNPKPPPTPTKLISVAKNMEAILLKKKEGVDVPTISTKSNNARLPGFM